MAERGSRLQSSVLTFGPLGRLVASALVLGVLAWFLVYAGPFGLVGVAVWGGYVLPRAMRDIWRPAALPPIELTRLREQTEREIALRGRPGRQNPAFDPGQAPPSRW